MSGPSGLDVQRAIDFLAGPDAAKLHQRPLPAHPAYDVLAARAAELGHELSGDALREAFRSIVRARLLAMRVSDRNGDHRR